MWCRRCDHALVASLGLTVLPPSIYHSYPPALIYTTFYLKKAKITNLQAGDILELHSEQLGYTDSKLYFFKQYFYMKERIDQLRTTPTQSGKDGAIVTGTPGIGRIRSTPLHSSNGFYRQIHLP